MKGFFCKVTAFKLLVYKAHKNHAFVSNFIFENYIFTKAVQYKSS